MATGKRIVVVAGILRTGTQILGAYYDARKEESFCLICGCQSDADVGTRWPYVILREELEAIKRLFAFGKRRSRYGCYVEVGVLGRSRM